MSCSSAPAWARRSSTQEFVRSLLFALKDGRPPTVVVDADALNTLGGAPGWAARVNVPLVLTPHPGRAATADRHEHRRDPERPSARRRRNARSNGARRSC